MNLLFMEEILHLVRCEKPCKWWDKVPINWRRIFFHQQYHKPQEISKKIWYLGSGHQNDGTFQVHHLDKWFRTPVIGSDPWSIRNYDVTQLGGYWKYMNIYELMIPLQLSLTQVPFWSCSWSGHWRTSSFSICCPALCLLLLYGWVVKHSLVREWGFGWSHKSTVYLYELWLYI